MFFESQQFRRDDRRQRQRVVQGTAPEAFVFQIEFHVLRRRIADETRNGRINFIQPFDVIARQQALIGHIQRNERDRDSRMKDDMRSVRVFMDVELRQRRDVAARADRSAHDDHLLDRIHDARFFADGKRDVGQWTDGEQADLLGFGEKAFDEVINGMSIDNRRSRIRQIGMTHSTGTMNSLPRRMRRFDERMRASTRNRDVSRVHHFQNGERVAGGFLQRDVSLHGGEGFELNFRRGEREQEGQRVVHAGVGIDDDAGWDQCSLLAASSPPGTVACASINFSTSSLVGKEGCAPNLVVASAPQAHP